MFPSSPWFCVPMGLLPCFPSYLSSLLPSGHRYTSSSRKPPQLTPASPDLGLLIASAGHSNSWVLLRCQADNQQPLGTMRRAAKPTLAPRQEWARLLQAAAPTHWLLFLVSKTLNFFPKLQVLLLFLSSPSTQGPQCSMPLCLSTCHPL